MDVVENRPFDEIQVGDSANLTRTLTREDFQQDTDRLADAGHNQHLADRTETQPAAKGVSPIPRGDNPA